MGMDYRKYYQKSTIGVSQQTKETLNLIKKGGQTYDRLIRELIDFWQSKNQEYWTRRNANKSKSKRVIG